jgi:hypothetical protein
MPVTRGYLDAALKDLRISLNDDIRRQVDKRIAELFPPPAPRVRPPTSDGSTVQASHIHHHRHYYYYYYDDDPQYWWPPPWW